MITKIDSVELQRRLREDRDVALIDVLPEEYFNAQHLPRARRAGVYEVTFLDQIKTLGLKPDDTLVLYGAGRGSLDSAVAAQKLELAGFTRLMDFSGGRAAWAEAGGAFEGPGALLEAQFGPDLLAYSISIQKSAIEWIGRNLNSIHHGTLRVSSGSVSLRAGLLQSGTILLDMRSIENTSLPDPAYRPVLEAHLKSDDFFDVENFPSAKLVIRSAVARPGATPGMPSQTITADLTIKDITHAIEFPAIVALGTDGNLNALAQFDIDRTRWNVIYGSGRFFQMLGKNLVNDAITLLVKLVATPA
jgi:polyisoprenoid-binding protein YceI/rhodanese-related sulfurtransferase